MSQQEFALSAGALSTSPARRESPAPRSHPSRFVSDRADSGSIAPSKHSKEERRFRLSHRSRPV